MGPEDDLQRMDEMNKRVVTSLLGLRNAKHGIERLEETISNAATTDPASSAKATGLRTSHTSGTCPACGHDPSSHYAHIPLPSVPRLYRYDPNFRLTPFGILTLVLAAWVLLESVFCALYCRPTEAVCAIAHLTSPGDGPCPLLMTRDPNGPYPFHALPTKLDEWLLGGRGLPLLAALSERAGDALADSWDAIVGADLTKVDPRRLDYWARYRLRRRLARRGLGFGGRVLTPEERMSWRQRLELMPDGKDRRLLEHWQAIGRAQEAELAAARKAGGGMHRGHGTAVGGRGDGGGADEGGGESMGADEDI